ncbi:hypothetical protein LCGC14_1078970, partial [marine sediment metagenome]
MGINGKNTVKESVKENKEKVKNDKDSDRSNYESKKINDKESKNEIKPKVKENYTEYNKEERENKWDKINWNKDISEKKIHNKWDAIDWKKDSSEKKNDVFLDSRRSEKEKIEDCPKEIVKESNDNEYRYLLERKITDTFISYYSETGKYANYGKNFTKNFIVWVGKNRKDPEMLDKINKIQNNQEISNFIVDKIQNTSNSQSEIIKSIENIGLHVSHGTIKNLALKEIFDNNLEQYKERFQSSKYKGISPVIRNSIKSRLIDEVKKVNPTSLDSLSKEFQVSRTTVNKIAKENINPDLFKKAWPPALTEISPKLKDDILKLLDKEIEKENPYSLKKISNEFNVSDVYLQNIAKERYPEQYHIKWPATLKIPTEIKQEIIKTIREESQKENPRTLKEIHETSSGVSYDAIKQLAKKVVSKEIREKIWAPLCKKIPTTITNKIEDYLKKEIIKAKPHSFNNIGKQFGVSKEYVRKTAIRIIPQPIYSKVWEPSLIELTVGKKKEIINYIQNTNLNLQEIAKKSGVHRHTVSYISQKSVFSDDINDHKIRFPKDLDLEIGTYTHKNINSIATIVVNSSNSKYFSEPKIFPDLRSSDGIIPEYNNFLKLRLNDPKIGEYLLKSLEITPKCKNIKASQFDFTNDISEENVINKIEKYQSPETILFIVGTKWDYFNEVMPLPNNSVIKYPENIKVISNNLFADLIGISGEEREIFDRIIQFNNNKDLDALKTLYNFDLSLVDKYNTSDLKNELIQKKLIQANFNEYFTFDDINRKEFEEKQLDLDYFLN